MRFWDGEFSILLIFHMLLMNAGFFILETELCKNGQVSSLQVLQRYAKKFNVCELKLLVEYVNRIRKLKDGAYK